MRYLPGSLLPALASLAICASSIAYGQLSIADNPSLAWDDDWDSVGTWRDNTLFWFGGDAYKSIGDSDFTTDPPDFMNSAGLVGGFNTGFRLLGDSPIRGQIGASYGVYDLNGRDTISQSSAEQQTFLTAGFYKRSDVSVGDRFQWGVLAGELYVGQVRGIVGWALNDSSEVGLWGALHTTDDDSVSDLIPSLYRAMNQYNVYWRYHWAFGGQHVLYVGGNDHADIGSWLFGLLAQAPLSDNIALFGNFTYDFPSSGTGFVGSNEEEWNFGAGLVYYLGGKAVSPNISGRQGLPLLPVANNGSLLITQQSGLRIR
jgi:hypothetical protein